MADKLAKSAPEQITTRCSKCAVNSVYTKAKYCNQCHRANMRVWRITHRLTAEQRKKMNCRSYANVYLKRGLLIKDTCKYCNSTHTQMHHPDYSQPLYVVWLCRTCHIEHHKQVEARGIEGLALNA